MFHNHVYIAHVHNRGHFVLVTGNVWCPCLVGLCFCSLLVCYFSCLLIRFSRQSDSLGMSIRCVLYLSAFFYEQDLNRPTTPLYTSTIRSTKLTPIHTLILQTCSITSLLRIEVSPVVPLHSSCIYWENLGFVFFFFLFDAFLLFVFHFLSPLFNLWNVHAIQNNARFYTCLPPNPPPPFFYRKRTNEKTFLVSLCFPRGGRSSSTVWVHRS